MTVTAAAGVLVALVGSACGSGREQVIEAGDGGARVTEDGVVVEHTWSGPGVGVEAVAALADGRVVALVSSNGDGAADTALLSPDGGRTWTAAEGPFSGPATPASNDDFDRVMHTGPRAHDAGEVILVTSTAGVDASGGSTEGAVFQQEVAVSSDGTSWSPAEVPAPEGWEPVVLDVAARGGVIVAVGTLEEIGEGTRPGMSLSALTPRYDGAAWVSADGGATFRSIEVPGAATEDFDAVRRVEVVGDRFVAVGATGARAGPDGSSLGQATAGWVSTDGESWESTTSPVGDPPPGFRVPADATWVVEDGEVLFGDVRAPHRLPAGSTTWEAVDLGAADVSGDGPILWAPLTGGGTVATWYDDLACDCSEAFAAAVDDLRTEAQLPFSDCDNGSVDDAAAVAAPVPLATTAAAALAWCGVTDEGVVLRLATTVDGGATWSTTALHALVDGGAADVVAPRGGFAPIAAHAVDTGDGLVVLGRAVGGDEPGVVALRVTYEAP